MVMTGASGRVQAPTADDLRRERTDDERWRDAALVAIAEHLNIWPDAVLGRTRTAEVAQARQIACVVLWHEAHLASERVGALMDRDHSTCLHACHTIESRAARDPWLAGLVADIRRDAARAYMLALPTPVPASSAPAWRPVQRPDTEDVMGLSRRVAWDTRGLTPREVAEAAYWRRRARERRDRDLGYAS